MTAVEFRNVPAFAAHLDQPVEVPHLGTVTVDVGWGGMFYVIADARQLDLELVPGNGGEIVRVTEMIKAAAAEQLPVVHPENPGIHDITIGQLYAPSPNPGVSRRNVVTVSTGQLDWDRPATWTGAIDRSPCGTGTCAGDGLPARQGAARARRARSCTRASSARSSSGRLVEETTVGGRPAVVPTIAGQAWITGFAQYVLDPTDPFPEGFTLGDIWGG